MSRFRFGILIAALLLAIPVWRVYRLTVIRSGFHDIKNGETLEQVKTRLGSARKITGCGVMFGSSSVGCRSQHIYADPWAPYIPEYWVIDYDANDRVVNKVRLVSP